MAVELTAFDNCPTLEILYTDGDRLPEWLGILQDVNLSGFTITADITRPSDVLTKTATITDAANGVFEFTWAVGDLVEGIGQKVLMRATDPDGKSETLARFVLDIGADPT